MTIKVTGYTTLTGRPEALLRLLDESRVFDKAEGNDYIERIVAAVEQLWGYHLEVSGDTYERRAKSLLKELDRHGLIKIEEQ